MNKKIITRKDELSGDYLKTIKLFKMKNSKFALYIVAFALVFASCKKSELEQNAPDQLTTDNFYTTKDKALAGLSAAYSQLESFVSWDNFVEARSVREFYREDFVLLGPDAFNYSWWTEHYNFNFTSGNYAIDLLWRDNYRGINFSNQVIEGVGSMPSEKIDEPSKKQIIAEAKFLRAYFHFKLLTNFQKIILRDKVPTSEADLNQPLSERKDVYDMILNDLKDAAADLPLRSQQPSTELGRVTKGAAQAYIGKINLYRTGEDQANAAAYLAEAATNFNAVITSNEYSLDNDFENMFNGITRNGVESVFELQQTADASNGANYRSYLNDWMAPWELGGYGEIYGTQRLVDEMKKEGKVAQGGLYDPRLYATLVFEDSYYNDAQTRVYGYTYDEVFGNGSGTISFKKWIPADIDRLGSSNAINIPLMRLADVMLLYAEVLNNQDKPADALVLINQLRNKRGNMPALNISTKADVFKAIVHERVMEFTVESSRFYDLRRWDLLEQNMQEAGRSFSSDKAFYPLPLKEATNNPATR